jgi:fatty-acyl-CoA synthase
MRPIDYFDKAAEIFPARLALVDHRTQRSWTYRELQSLSQRIASGLWARGLRGAFTAAICSPNDPGFLMCQLGIMRAGGVVVPINATTAPRSLREYLQFVRAECLFCHSSVAANLALGANGGPLPSLQICLDDAAGGHLSLAELIDTAPDVEMPWADAQGNPDRIVMVSQTGGTTNEPRAVRLTAVQWATQLETNRHYLERGLDPGVVPVNMAATPLTHRAGWIAHSMLAMGATIVVLPSLDPGEALRGIGRYRVTHLWVPPTALYLLLAHPDVQTFDYRSLRCLLVGTAPVAPDKMREAVRIFGPALCQSYGQTETGVMTWLTSPAVAAAAAGRHPERLQSCGQAVYSMRVTILDDAGREAPPGQAGEIAVRGRAVTVTGCDGWHRTGDIGHHDADGYIYIVDRKKDVVVRGGFSVYAFDLERTILELDDVHDCAVIAVPDDLRGEQVKAVVVVKPGRSISADALMRHCRMRLGGDHAPGSVDLIEEIPRTAAGKADKRALRARYWQGERRNVH